MDSFSVVGSQQACNDSDIGVIACYRKVPVGQQGAIAGYQMTTDLSDCLESGHPEFHWEEFKDDLGSNEPEPNPLQIQVGPHGHGLAQKCSINRCAPLTPSMDSPLSPPLVNKDLVMATTTMRDQISWTIRPNKLPFSRD